MKIARILAENMLEISEEAIRELRALRGLKMLAQN
jgi:hypothetical protein